MLLFLGIVSAAPHTAILETIPAVAVGSSTAVLGCTVLSIMPGSIIENSAGFVRASCPGIGYAIDFHHTLSETPTFVNPGWTQIVLMQIGYSCSFNFLQGSLVGANMTTLTPISFSDSATNSSLGAGSGTPFDYCLYYANPPVSGFASFSITWS